MISQRDINAFFEILAVLSDPEKARNQLQVFNDIRTSVDADRELVKKETARAQNMVSEAKELEKKGTEALVRAEGMEQKCQARIAELAALDKKLVEANAKQVEIKQLQDARETQLDNREAALEGMIKRYETSLTDFNIRNEALRKNEAEYRERMAKLKAIAN